MRHWILFISLLLLTGGMTAKEKRLTPREKQHYEALKVWMEPDEVKAYLKNKTPEARDQWLKDQKFWDRFYRYDKSMREAILAREVSVGWPYDAVYMALGRPHVRKRLAGRQASRSELLVYRIEVSKDGYHEVWTPKSKTTYKAIRKYRMEYIVDDGVVAKVSEVPGWQ